MGLVALTIKGIGGSHCGVDGLDHEGDRRKPLWG